MQAKSQAGDLLLGIEPTRHCNLRCRHCLRQNRSRQGELPLPLFERILDEAQCFGRPHIALTGGEPTLHSRFFDLLAAVSRRGLTCHFVSNGTTFGRLAAHLADIGPALSGVSFSLDGASERTHDALRGRGTFRQTALAIALARHRGLYVTVQLVVTRLNRHELTEMPALCGDLGAQALFFSHAQPSPSLYEHHLQLSPAEWRGVEEETSALGRSSSVGIKPRLAVGGYDPGALAPCTALQHQSLNVDWQGRLTLCCQLSGTSAEAKPADAVADLRRTSLPAARAQLLGLIDEVLRERLAAMSAGRFDGLDAFQCWFCHKRFRKIDWLAEYPDDPWVQGEPYFARRHRAAPAVPKKRGGGR